MTTSRTFTSTLFFLFSLLTFFLSFTSVFALPIDIAQPIERDIWSPRVLTPNAEVGWVIDTQTNVTWDTSDAPQNISNAARVVLAKGGSELSEGPGSYQLPLAKDFDLRDGFVTVTVPDVEPGDDYQVVLFGDSGNLGPFFTISEAA